MSEKGFEVDEDETVESEPIDGDEVIGGFKPEMVYDRFPKVGFYVRSSAGNDIFAFQINGHPYAAKSLGGGFYLAGKMGSNDTYFLHVNKDHYISMPMKFLVPQLQSKVDELIINDEKLKIISILSERLKISSKKFNISHLGSHIYAASYEQDGIKEVTIQYIDEKIVEVEVVEA